jgi:hypothetical protein
MSSFDTTLSPLGLNLAIDNNPENPMLHLVITVGAMIPIEVSPGQPLVFPTGIYRIPIPRQLALDLAPKIQEEAEKLPEPKPKTDIVVPTGPVNDDQLKKVVQTDQQFRGPANQ